MQFSDNLFTVGQVPLYLWDVAGGWVNPRLWTTGIASADGTVACILDISRSC